MPNPFLLRQAAMYLAYHRDARNVATHVFGIPAIIFAILLVFQRVDLSVLLPGLTLGWVAVLAFAVFYLWLQLLSGAILTMLLALAVLAAAPLALLPAGSFWSVVSVFFIGGWALQLIGHAVFEHRRPALTDNLIQIFIAPLFLVLEALFRCGVLRDLEAEIERMSHAHDRAPGAA